jgi:hypothetical protein
MATFDQLPADQRAIIELVLGRGQSYDDLSGMLGLPTARVRELARDALVELSPATASRVPEDWRGQVADYVLGQAGPEQAATRTHLRRSEAARTWALSLLDSLDPLFANGTRPEIPEAEAERSPRAVRAERTTRPARERPARTTRPRPDAERPARPLSPEAATVVRRRRIAAGAAGALALLLLLLFAWPGWLRGGDDDGDERAERPPAQNAAAQPQPVGSPVIMRPLRGEEGQGGAIVVRRGNELFLIVQATGLKPSAQPPRGQREGGDAYEVWLYNSASDAKSLGGQVTDQQGNYQGAGPLPRDFEKYRFIDISREPFDRNARHSGDSVLRGRLADVARPLPEGAQGGGQVPPGGAQAPQGGQAPGAQPAPGGQPPAQP